MMRLLKDPACHFAILSALIFALYYAAPQQTTSPPQAQANDIVVEPDDLRSLALSFQSTWQRLPNPDELNALMNATIEDEVLSREAIALGLDQNDASIRQRLVQKMRFLMDSSAQALQPDDATLQAHLDQNVARFSAPSRLSFTQIYLGESPADAKAVLAQLESGADPATLSVRTMIPFQFSETIPRQIDAQFGRGFAARLAVMPTGTWTFAPSGLGAHLVRVEAITPPQTPALADVKDKVLADWRQQQAEVLTAAQIADLMAKYDITLPDKAAFAEVLAK